MIDSFEDKRKSFLASLFNLSIEDINKEYDKEKDLYQAISSLVGISRNKVKSLSHGIAYSN